MKPNARLSIRKFTLGTELAWIFAVIVPISVILSVNYKQQQQHFYELAKADSQRVEAFFQQRLDTVRTEFFETANAIAKEARTARLESDTFRDFYALDDDFRVTEIYKQSAQSFVFTGFSFAGGGVGKFLGKQLDKGGFSSFARGYEDDRISLYYVARLQGKNFLARVNLEQFERMINTYKVFGTNVLLVLNPERVVVFATDSTVRPASFLLKENQPAFDWSDTRTIAQRKWLPIISNSEWVESTIVTLIPADTFQEQLDRLRWAGFVLLALLVMLFWIRGEVTRRLVVRPLVGLAESLQKIKLSSKTSPSLAPGGQRFQEFEIIDHQMQEMLSAIQGREQDLALAKERAERLEKVKSDFLATMSHEIRTPLTIVLGVAELLQRQPLGEEQRRLVASLEAASTNLLGVINDVLDISRIEANRLSLRNAPIDLVAVVQQVVELQRILADKKGLYLRLDARITRPFIVLADELRLTQILQNLISNAIKFTETGGVSVGLEAAVTAGQQTPGKLDVALTVTDTGIGIRQADQHTLFEPFVQVDQGQRRRYGGSGLGLAIASRLVKLMSGCISVTSTPGQGSSFRVCFSFDLAA